ncbi:interferon-induced very large GTPase 1-like [Pundamilia nyererei]|uniref:Interferon-induced very large GTPase 1-like n=1 Tax=Pundamilia nyererei TaxID=303518 RepID=A0A9Y3VZC5_9CICH|nr:PREDICTED: interferon-induced very large GTPase 1-like [Pundamilia nyererei]
MENLHSTAAAGGGEAEIRSEVSSLKENCDTDPVFCFFVHEGEEDENEERSNKGSSGEDVSGNMSVNVSDELTKYPCQRQTETLIDRLQLQDKLQQKFSPEDFLQIRPPVTRHHVTSEKHLAHMFVRRLMTLDCRARYIPVRADSPEGTEPKPRPVTDIPEKDYSDWEVFLNTSVDTEQTRVHPMDVQMAVFHCSDSFLKQTMVTKLSQCQYALPLLVPDPVTMEMECPLWTFRQITKTWTATQIKDGSPIVTMKSVPVCKAQTPLVSFFRLGSLSVSKSQLMNALINDRHSTFFHRNCPGSTRSRHLMDGVAEIAWYCPAGKPTDAFRDCMAFCNLHGDALQIEKQRDILIKKSSINVFLVASLQKDEESRSLIAALFKSHKPLICLSDDDSCDALKTKKGKYKMGLKGRNQSDVSEELKKIIREVLSSLEESSVKPSFQLEALAELSGVRVDEKNISSVLQSYDEKWLEVLALKNKHDKSGLLLMKQTELQDLSHKLQSASFGLEHMFREMAHIYEAHRTTDGESRDADWCKYPELAAQLMISGHPVELMDGDAGHLPFTWISSLLEEVIQKLGDQRVFVLSVLDLQSSGKTSLLSSMFGLQPAVGAGRSTKGAFMQLLKVSEDMKTDVDYVLVVETEGLQASELDGNNTRYRDNELATFVIALGNVTLISIFGDNLLKIQDILQIVVQALMRMKKVQLSPRCVFVQDVPDVAAAEKNVDRKRRLQEHLDQMTKLAAEEELCDAERFSDVIEFDVQEDVKYCGQLWEGSPPMAAPNPAYSESLQEVKNTILSKASKSAGITLSQLRTKIQDLWNSLLSENFVFSFKNTLEVVMYRKLEVLARKQTSDLRSNMKTEDQLLSMTESGKHDEAGVSYLYQETN